MGIFLHMTDFPYFRLNNISHPIYDGEYSRPRLLYSSFLNVSRMYIYPVAIQLTGELYVTIARYYLLKLRYITGPKRMRISQRLQVKSWRSWVLNVRKQR